MQNLNRVAAIAVFGALLLSPGVTRAQQPLSKDQAPVQRSDVTDAQLRSFAKVYVQIEKILKTYQPQAEQAKTAEEDKQIQSEAMSKINQALAQEGLDTQSYHRIIEAANADAGLRKKVMGFINEEKQKP